MKQYKCPCCFRNKEVEDNVLIVVCKNCLTSMKEIKKEGENEKY